jgi:GAF domain-containing protein
MAHRPDIAGALAQAAREIGSARDLSTTLDAIVHTALASLPGVDHVGISIAHKGGRGRIETVAATDQLVWELDALQYELGEGPCVYAIEEAAVSVAEHAHHEQRWPRYIPEAVKRGLRAQMGLRLYVDGKTLGGLNLYSVEAEQFQPDTAHLAELFATHAALALGKAREHETLNAALATRADVGKAVGILMMKYGLTDERAFEYLIRVSSHSNVKVRDVAAEVVAQANDAHSNGAVNGTVIKRPAHPVPR